VTHAGLTAAADLLWPRRCAGCEVQPVLGAQALCADCRTTLSPLDPRSSCPRCTAPLATLAERSQDSCPDCRRLPLVLSRILAPYEYGGALADALLRLKWKGRDDLARPLGGLLAPCLTASLLRDGKARGGDLAFDVLLPVPLHPRRLRQRGYNQATLLGRAALEAAGLRRQLPLWPTALCRLRSDPPARSLSPAERFRRALGAFAVSERAAARLAGKRVLLVDDVVTTGATVLGCAVALRTAGAAHVEALALLRAAA
jgi:ComF family protein